MVHFEVQDLTNRPEWRSAQKRARSWSTAQTTSVLNGQKLEEVINFKYPERQKLAWFHACHTPWHFWQLLEGGRRCGWKRKCYTDNTKEWTSLRIPELLTRTSCRKDWKRISAESSFMSPDEIGQGTELSWTNCCCEQLWAGLGNWTYRKMTYY